MNRALGEAWIGRSVEELPTPCLTLDLPLLEANLALMQAKVARAGKALRPHAKSHKSTRIARLQREAGAVGICAAKLSEAEGLAVNAAPVLLTGPAVSVEAHERLARLATESELLLTLDDLENARAISQALERVNAQASFLLDLDVGQGRTGVAPAQALEAAREMAALPGLELIGIQAYAGHLQHLVSRQERAAVNSACMERACEVFTALGNDGARVLSVGGTGSVEWDLQIPEVTEVQPGSYLLMDADYLAIEPSREAAWPFAPALNLQTRVMSRRSDGSMTVDAGLKALYRDGPAPIVTEGRPWVYDWFGDEYGRLTPREEGATPLRLGERVPMIVSHCDPTVNLFDGYYILQAGIVIDVWPIDLRGCSY